MVRAILAGRKTVTRRIVEQDTKSILSSSCRKENADIPDSQFISKLCLPRYEVNDILYVRETWDVHDLNEGAFCMMIKYKADGATELQVKFTPSRYDIFRKFYYKDGWKPSRFMPKEAARFFLRVTGVRVEQLKKISCEESVKEGAVKKPHYVRYGGEKCLAEHARYRKDFADLWNSTIKKQDINRYGWESNPWVWVYEFERCDRPDEWAGEE